jgi:hypothetical protein
VPRPPSTRSAAVLASEPKLQILAEYVSIQEQQRAQRVVAGRRGNHSLDRQVRQKSLHFCRPHRIRVSHIP